MLKVLFFGQLKERLKTDCLQLEDSPDTVAKLRALLQERGESWDECLEYGKALAAVNQEMASELVQIHDGDEVAFFPPVTGG